MDAIFAVMLETIASQTLMSAIYTVCLVSFSIFLRDKAPYVTDFTGFMCNGANKSDEDTCLSFYRNGPSGLPSWFCDNVYCVNTIVVGLLTLQSEKFSRVKEQTSSKCKIHTHMVHFGCVAMRLLVHLVIVGYVIRVWIPNKNQLTMDKSYNCTIGNYTRLCSDGEAESRLYFSMSCFVVHVVFLFWNFIELGYISWAWRRKSKMLNEVTNDGSMSSFYTFL